MKPIRLSKHARGYFGSRGFSKEEVEEAIHVCGWVGVEGRV
jgi:hypothetical protein